MDKEDPFFIVMFYVLAWLVSGSVFYEVSNTGYHLSDPTSTTIGIVVGFVFTAIVSLIIALGTMAVDEE